MRSPTVVVYGVVALLGVALCFTPLFNLIGYESAAVMGIAVGLGSAFLTLRALRTGALQPPLDPARATSPAADFCGFLPRSLGLVLPPLALLGLNAARVRNCDPALGGEFWLLIPVVSAVLGQGLAWLAAAVTAARWGRVALVAGVLVADLGWFLWRLATQPPITGHGLLFGWFAGSIYDEDLSVPGHLWWVRLTLLGLVACVVLGTERAWRRRSGRPSRAAAWGLVAFAVPTLYAVATAEAHGVALDREDIIAELGGTVETEHFFIHYDPSEVQGERLELLVEDHEFRYAEMEAFLGVDPVAWRGRKVRSFVYPTVRAQSRLMGSRGTLVARPWTHEMHIRWTHYTDNALAHELAHIFSAVFGGGPLELATRGGLLPDIGLLEGLALAADWPPHELDPHESAAAMRALDIAPDIRSIFSPTGFWAQPGRKAYTLMGSFVRWLIETHGMEPFQQVYGHGDFEAVYGRPAVALIADWEAYVDGLTVSDELLELARYRYKHKSIFGKTCARAVADLKRQARGATGQRDFGRALELWEQIRAFNHTGQGRPEQGLEEAELLDRLERFDDALAILDGLLGREGKRRLRPARRAQVLELKGDISWRAGRTAEAADAYTRSLTLGVPDTTRRMLQVKLRAVEDPDGEVRGLARDYLLENDGGRSALYKALTWANLRPGDPLPRYLVGVQLSSAQERAAALSTLAGPPGLLPTPHLDEQRRLLLAENAYELRRLDEADAWIDTLEGSESSRKRSFAEEYRARVAWMRGRLQQTGVPDP